MRRNYVTGREMLSVMYQVVSCMHTANCNYIVLDIALTSIMSINVRVHVYKSSWVLDKQFITYHIQSIIFSMNLYFLDIQNVNHKFSNLLGNGNGMSGNGNSMSGGSGMMHMGRMIHSDSELSSDTPSAPASSSSSSTTAGTYL